MTGRNDPEVVAEAKERFGDDIPELADALFLREVIHLLRLHQENNPAVDQFMKHHNLTQIYPTVRSVMARKTDQAFQFASSAEADAAAFHTKDIDEWDAANRHSSDKNK